MSLNFRKGIIFEYQENVRIYNDYFNLLLEKETYGGPVVVKAIELRRKNRLQGKKPIIYRCETNEDIIVDLLDKSDIKVANTELYAKKLLEHLVFNYKKNELRILTIDELNAKKEKNKEEKSNVHEIQAKDHIQSSTSTLVGSGGSSSFQLRSTSLYRNDASSIYENTMVVDESDGNYQRGKRKAFLSQLSTIRKYFMEKTTPIMQHRFVVSNDNNRNNNKQRIDNNNNIDKASIMPILRKDDEEDDNVSTTSDGQDNRLLDIHDCGEIVPAHPMWGVPGVRVRKAKNKYLYTHGAPNIDKMIHKNKFSGGFNHKVYVSNLQYPPRKNISSPTILLGNAKASMHGKLYRRWSLKSLKQKKQQEEGNKNNLVLNVSGLQLVPEGDES